MQSILRDGKLFVEQVRTSQRTPLVSVLLHGPPGSGKTALAATIALASEFPFIKLISAENMVGFSEAQKINHLYKVFSDSYKSPLSVIVVDGIERILGEWRAALLGSHLISEMLMRTLAQTGSRSARGSPTACSRRSWSCSISARPRYVLSCCSCAAGSQLTHSLARPPCLQDRRLLILSTTSNRAMLTEMDAMDAFATTLRVPAITTLRQLEAVLADVGLFRSPAELARALELLRQAGLDGEDKLAIGVKRLLTLVEMCRQDQDSAVDKLVTELVSLRI